MMWGSRVREETVLMARTHSEARVALAENWEEVDFERESSMRMPA